jgi:hypothetical protein
MQFNGESKNVSAEELMDILIADSLRRNVSRYGIEGLEDKIKELYVLMPTARDKMLAVYRKMYKYDQDKSKS